MRIEKTLEMLDLARRLVWFTSPEAALDEPRTFLAHVMTFGLLEDVLLVRSALGTDAFRQVLDQPPAGIFDARSWAYWNLLYERWPTPPLPERLIPCTSGYLSP
jgi:hypothetical protein